MLGAAADMREQLPNNALLPDACSSPLRAHGGAAKRER